MTGTCIPIPFTTKTICWNGFSGTSRAQEQSTPTQSGSDSIRINLDSAICQPRSGARPTQLRDLPRADTPEQQRSNIESAARYAAWAVRGRCDLSQVQGTIGVQIELATTISGQPYVTISTEGLEGNQAHIDAISQELTTILQEFRFSGHNGGQQNDGVYNIEITLGS